MTATTKAPYLRLVTGTTAAVSVLPLPATTLAQLPDRLAELRDNAHRAALAPDVVEQKQADIAEALADLKRPGANPAAILRLLADRMYAAGHMDGAADSRPNALAELALASITRIDRQRDGSEPA